MTFDEYQQAALKTAIYSGDDMLDLAHWTLGLTGESGEIAEKVKKVIRDDYANLTDEKKAELAKEAGDVLWYIAVFAHSLGVSLEDLAQNNIEKLRSRQQRGKLGGSGDNR